MTRKLNGVLCDRCRIFKPYYSEWLEHWYWGEEDHYCPICTAILQKEGKIGEIRTRKSGKFPLEGSTPPPSA